MLNTKPDHATLAKLSAAEVRAAIRRGDWDRHTAGLAAGKLQCNLAILPEAHALDFLRFCQRNPKPCPVVGVSDTGDPILPTLGRDIDIRSDVPRYRVFRDGEMTEEVTDIADLWRDDLVTVALGCSFTFENALMRAGIPVRHVELDRTVPMFNSDIELVPAGPFHGKMVVTMRPIPEDSVEDAWRISARFPQAHGAPLGRGDPAGFGIADLDAPDYGEAVPVHPGEVPVYWACGVTPQNVLRAARLPFCITHAPGHMLIADVAEDAATTVLQP
ncbi:putative hydro-lyase [Jannaschia ovalis]|uniref:Putative hydro-lyase P8627_13350 n=1 Tax=Jannaschia ovalis TaxID=3038773 RepID=A0ABY8L9H5_9RHOB|nr:putative hydro-lyase [Jannaschia sp. GRR-S6-38]WGH78007.1 putative hydro-lyase [Jannaschia sp. GRR-S6-38]